MAISLGSFEVAVLTMTVERTVPSGMIEELKRAPGIDGVCFGASGIRGPSWRTRKWLLPGRTSGPMTEGY
jgi:hypothetical protein